MEIVLIIPQENEKFAKCPDHNSIQDNNPDP